MKSDDMYFVSLLFAYGAELDNVECGEVKKQFCFSDKNLDSAYVLENSELKEVKDLELKQAYSLFQTRKLLYPPNFPDGRRRFLELLHANKF